MGAVLKRASDRRRRCVKSELTPPTKDLSIPVRFRECRRQDLQKLEWGGLFTEHRQIIHDAYRRQRAGKNLMLQVEANAVPAGQIWIDFERRQTEGVAVLWAFRVCPWLQGLGLGTELLTWAEQTCARRGFRQVELGVEIRNVAALRFYKQHGFKVCGKEEETLSYTTPTGERRTWTQNEWILRKQLEMREPLLKAGTDYKRCHFAKSRGMRRATKSISHRTTERP
jgi:GNAT superfamily N-acetyltransferase